MGEIDTDTMSLEEVLKVLMRSADDPSLPEPVRRGELLAAISLRIVRRKYPELSRLDVVNRAADMVLDRIEETWHLDVEDLREVALLDETRIADAFAIACRPLACAE